MAGSGYWHAILKVSECYLVIAGSTIHFNHLSNHCQKDFETVHVLAHTLAWKQISNAAGLLCWK